MATIEPRPVELLRAILAAIGPANATVPAVREAYNFLETLDEPAPIDAPRDMVEAVANDCAVDLLREAVPFIDYIGPNGRIKERIGRYLAQLDGVPVADEYVVFVIGPLSGNVYDQPDYNAFTSPGIKDAKRYTEAEAIARVEELRRAIPAWANRYGYEPYKEGAQR